MSQTKGKIIRVAHFATKQALLPLLDEYGVNPNIRYTWHRAPMWLKRLWEVAKRRHIHRDPVTDKYPQTHAFHTYHRRFTRPGKRARWPRELHAEVRSAIEGAFR